MNKLKVLKVLNPLVFLFAVCQAVTILLIKLTSIGWIVEVHEWIGIALLVCILVHLVLNWNWVKANFFTKKG